MPLLSLKCQPFLLNFLSFFNIGSLELKLEREEEFMREYPSFRVYQHINLSQKTPVRLISEIVISTTFQTKVMIVLLVGLLGGLIVLLSFLKPKVKEKVIQKCQMFRYRIWFSIYKNTFLLMQIHYYFTLAAYFSGYLSNSFLIVQAILVVAIGKLMLIGVWHFLWTKN